jgi:hypothetical protein
MQAKTILLTKCSPHFPCGAMGEAYSEEGINCNILGIRVFMAMISCFNFMCFL